MGGGAACRDHSSDHIRTVLCRCSDSYPRCPNARPVADLHRLKATTPAMLTPLAVIGGLLIAFLATRVWNNLDRATVYVAQEATSIREAMAVVEALPSYAAVAIRHSMREYLTFVDEEDWPAMEMNRASLKHKPKAMTDAIRAAFDVNPTTHSQQIAQQHVIIALERAMEARRSRILLSRGVIAPIQWLVVIVLDVLMLIVVAMVHIDRPRTIAINLGILSTAVAACLVLLLVHDRPFTSGGFTLQPVALREIIAGE